VVIDGAREAIDESMAEQDLHVRSAGVLPQHERGAHLS
jgi:hypothetical protein